MSDNNHRIFLLGLINLFLTLVLINCDEGAASKCRPSGRIKGKKLPPGECMEDDLCCVEGRMYKVYECSPSVTAHTKAYMTINSFEGGGDGGAPAKCDNRYYSDDTPVVALSTGWYEGGSRCLKNVTIRAPSGRSVEAMVVDECDSSVGCGKDEDYQPPCANNVVDSSVCMIVVSSKSVIYFLVHVLICC